MAARGGKGARRVAEGASAEHPPDCSNDKPPTNATPAVPEALRSFPVQEVYAELRSYAQRLLRKERTDHTLQATALVHEAWSRLAQDESGRWREPGEFFAIATRVMEQVLVDHARRHASMKRGAGRTKLGAGLDGRGATLGAGDDGTDYVEMHRALCELERADPRAAALVRLRFFAGLTARQAAEVLGISLPAADGEWRATRAWLSARLRRHLAADIS